VQQRVLDALLGDTEQAQILMLVKAVLGDGIPLPQGSQSARAASLDHFRRMKSLQIALLAPRAGIVQKLLQRTKPPANYVDKGVSTKMKEAMQPIYA
jgi:hypothetical protein